MLLFADAVALGHSTCVPGLVDGMQPFLRSSCPSGEWQEGVARLDIPEWRGNVPKVYLNIGASSPVKLKGPWLPGCRVPSCQVALLWASQRGSSRFCCV